MTLRLQKLLLPVDYPNASPRVVQQAAMLARQFHGEIVLLHVADAASCSAGLPRGEAELAAWDMLPELREARASEAATSLRPELEGVAGAVATESTAGEGSA
jgi:nucleotide-binding universal stress UspA family protein